MDLTPKAHTAAVLKRMQLSGSVPSNLNRNNDTGGDNFGLTAARSSDASSFGTDGAPKSPHMGRPGRQSGGRITGQLIRTRRTPEETARDIAEEDKVANALAKDREGRKKGGRIGRWQGGPNRDVVGQKDLYDTLPPEERPQGFSVGGVRDPLVKPYYNFVGGGLGHRSVGALYDQGGIGSDETATPPRAKGGRVDRARGGRTKGKTTVNVIIGGQKPAQPPAPAMPPPPPPPMAAPGPVGPPKPPMMPPPGMPPGGPGGAPPGMGGPPPGGPPMLRARGGRIGKQMGGGMPMQQGGMGQRPWGQGGGAPNPQIQQAIQNFQQQRMGQGALGQPQMPQRGQMPQMGGGQMCPPGAPMMQRARGGRIEISTPGVHDYGKAGVKHGSVDEEYGAGSGLGRQERARRQK